jgi:DNA-binding MarR family transcriptional regulator
LKPETSLRKSEERALRNASAMLEAFHKVHSLMSFKMAQTFIMVALDEGKSMTEYSQKAGLPQSTISRHLLDLGERNRKKEPGLNLVVSRRDPQDYRRWTYSLAPKGSDLIQRLLDGAK